MDKVVVTSVGIGLIAVIYWFFFGKKSGEAGSGSTVEASDTWTIMVDGGYKPNIITLKQNQPAKLTFVRKDANSCLEEVIFPDYKIKEYLPLNQPVTITLPPPHPAKSGFHCGMSMFQGRIEVRD